MNFNLIKLLAFLTVFLASSHIYSQDIITMKDGKEINVKIKEILDDEIIYYEGSDIGGVEYSVNKSEIKSVSLGSTEPMNAMEVEKEAERKSYTAPASPRIQYVPEEVLDIPEGPYKNMAIKFSPTAMFGSSLMFSFERAISRIVSLELDLKIHTVLVDQAIFDKTGFGIGFGPKFRLKDPEYHYLEGAFIKPILNYSTGSENAIHDYNYLAGGLLFGKQWVFYNQVSFEIAGGPHLYTGDFSWDSDASFEGSNLGVDFADGDLIGNEGIGGSFAIKLGYTFGEANYTPENTSRRVEIQSEDNNEYKEDTSRKTNDRRKKTSRKKRKKKRR